MSPIHTPPAKTLKADLHVHSYFSGKTAHVKLLEPMDSYSSPETICRLSKARGMDLATITDHDSIEGCLHLLNIDPDKIKDFIIGEEVSVYLPEFDCKIHVGVYDITEAEHREITRLKRDFDELIGYLRSRKIIYCLNHMLFGFPKQRFGEAFLEKMLESFTFFEGWNGAISSLQNELVSKTIGQLPGKTLLAGSDSHTLLRLATSYTVAPGSNKAEFLESLRRGEASIHGKEGRFFHVFYDAMGVYLAYFRDVAFRNEVHRRWSTYKKVRNGFGWAFWLPVFFILSLGYTFYMYRLVGHQQPWFETLLQNALDQFSAESEARRCSQSK